MPCPLSPQTWWRTHVKQAPLDWWMDLNRKLLVILFMSTALIGVIQGINLSIDAKTRDLSYLMLVLTCACSVTALVVTKCSLPCVTEVVFISCGFLMIPAVMSATVLMSDDPTYRLRTHAISMTLWKFGPAVFGLPFLATFIFIGATIVMDIGTLLLCQVFHDDPFQLRMVASSPAYALGAIAMAFMQMGRLCSIYDAQQALAAEKALMESIISMMCDAIVWLSEDGSTVLRSDARFAMLVGRSAVGEQASAWTLPDLEERMPAMELARASQRRASAAPTSGGPPGLAANLQSVHDALDAMAGQDSQPDSAGGAGRSAAPAATGAEVSAPMALPALLETQDAAKSSMLEDVLRRWNCRRAPDSCCEYHAPVAELQRMGQWLMTSRCRPDFAPRGEFQCRSCGVLDCEARPVCPICGDGGTSGLASIQGEFPQPVDGSAGTRALCSL